MKFVRYLERGDDNHGEPCWGTLEAGDVFALAGDPFTTPAVRRGRRIGNPVVADATD